MYTFMMEWEMQQTTVMAWFLGDIDLFSTHGMLSSHALSQINDLLLANMLENWISSLKTFFFF